MDFIRETDIPKQYNQLIIAKVGVCMVLCVKDGEHEVKGLTLLDRGLYLDNL